MFGFDCCCYVVEALEGAAAATSFQYEHNDLEHDEIDIDNILLQELDRDSDDDLDDDSTKVSNTDAASTVDWSSKAEINLQTLFFPE